MGLRIAATRGTRVVVCVPGRGGEGSAPVDLTETGGDSASEARLRSAVRQTADAVLGEEGWEPEPVDAPAKEPSTESGDKQAPEEQGPPVVCLRRLSSAQPVDALMELVHRYEPRALVAIHTRLEGPETETSRRRRRILGEVACEVILVRLGREGAGPRAGGPLATVARGLHCKAALSLANAIAEREGKPLTALYVEPDVGEDAQGVGNRILDRIVTRALGSPGADVVRRVRVEPQTHVGILEEWRESPHELLVMGSSKAGGLGKRLRGTVPQRVLRADEDLTAIVVRAALPFTGRAVRRIEQAVQGVVPQLEREQRLDLVERVQSNSSWDFDFIALMSLSSLIAAMGLVVNSSAVIIGAMLVAPLMTPLLGLGLGLVQGNPVLGRMSLRSIVLGFIMSFGLSWLVGVTSPGFILPTEEMTARSWPVELDLLVAFVAGLAAAYASSRPGLLAALPGVAIAAALVPPIATSGLALSIGEYVLAFGSFLLFLVNTVAIALAAAVVLWMVGLRYVKSGSHWSNVAGRGLVLSVFLLGVVLVLTPADDPPQRRIPRKLRKAVTERVEEITVRRRLEGDEVHWRLRSMEVIEEDDVPLVIVRIGGETPPRIGLVDELHDAIANVYSGEFSVRVQYVLELELR
jgi:uncharacterized hydrophobic protein (TIGR00271 family)